MESPVLSAWRRLRACRSKKDLLAAVGRPDTQTGEHPKEDWSEYWGYAGLLGPSNPAASGFAVRLDGDLIYAVDTLWRQEPRRLPRAELARRILVGMTDDEVLAALGVPDHWHPQAPHLVMKGEAWYYQHAEKPQAAAAGIWIVFKNLKVRAVRSRALTQDGAPLYLGWRGR